jgi:hypothetical protein
VATSRAAHTAALSLDCAPARDDPREHSVGCGADGRKESRQ